MDIDSMIDVLQAYKEGKPIEAMPVYGILTGWRPVLSHKVFDFESYVYRVKKEPKEYYLRLDNMGAVVGVDYEYTPNIVTHWSSGASTFVRSVKVREVME